jgi:hypothetical protein
MAMIKCPECGEEVSDKAKKCIHCGKILIEEPKKICSDCGKEVDVNATECPYCGCPIEEEKKDNISVPTVSEKPKKDLKKVIIPIVVSVIVAIIGLVIYNVKVVQPKKIAAENKATYEEAISLLEKGKYEDGRELLETISDYEDVSTILEQIKWESRVYECITDIRQYLKNPDSLQIYEVVFYDGFKSDIDERIKTAMKEIIKLSEDEPVCVMYRGGQNGFGGNTTGYSLFLYSDGQYKYIGSCDSLDEDEIDKDEDELICGLINAYKDNLEQVGDVDLARIKTIIKNDSYSTIKIIG